VTTLRPPLDPADVTASVVRATLADPAPDPVVARYAGQTLYFISATPDGSPTFDLSWPATGEVRILDPAETPELGVGVLLELSPLPFGLEPVLQRLAPGVPTFYVGYTGAPAPTDHDLVRITDTPLSVARAVVGVVFQDRIALQPWAWIDLIAGALEGVDAAAFGALAELVDSGRSVRVLDAAGRPAPGESFVLRILDASGTELSSTPLTTDAEGDLGTDPVVPAGRRATLEWQPPPQPIPPRPVVTHYEGALSDTTDDQGDDSVRAVPAPGEELLRLPAGFAGGHLQVLDLARWLAPAVPNPLTPAWPAHFRTHSHLRPIVDGIEMFEHLVEDLRECRFAIVRQNGEVDRGGAHLAGWSFKDFELVPGDADSTLPALVEFIRTAPIGDPEQFGEVRILAAQFVQANPGLFQSLDQTASIALGTFLIAAFFAGIISREAGVTDAPGLFTWQLAAAVLIAFAVAELLTASDIEAFVKDKAEKTKPELLETLNANGTIALLSRHPARLADNPLSTDFDVGVQLSDASTKFGIFHQKIQVVRRRPDGDHPDSGDGFHYAGYVGGVDISDSRLDTPGHHGKRAFHDVHARVTGPAVIDLFGTFHDRWERDKLETPGAPDVPFDPPQTVPPSGGHIIQVGRTAFRPAPGGSGFGWAPTGDITTRATIGRAIEAGREYIYVEDQYFAPDDEYVRLLRDAADHCKRLVIVMPSDGDQPASDDRHSAVFPRLSGATGGAGGWGERMFVRAPLRRPILVPTSKTSSVGRCFLVEDVPDAAMGQIFLGPPTRVPKTTPYFVWVGGELMAAQNATLVTTISGKPAMQLDVIRGGLGTQPRWYEHPRGHAKGEPATVVKMQGIYVHSKVIVVDDVFVGIGSTNSNRRGFFHDGEITAFTIPERLRAARDNPALALRTALWAEHLGVPPAMGRALLADPIAAFELFRRTRYEGNRLVPFRELKVPFAGTNALAGLLPDSLHVLGLAVANLVESAIEAHRAEFWNTLSDPTSFAEPNPVAGPELP
jgi:phosphatidylserine/phosphatidylglycerophosphate/cardiolipin synthase-like enzyme